VQEILEKVVDRLSRIEAEAARSRENASDAPRSAPNSGARPAPRDPKGASDAIDEAMRGIPDRAPGAPAKPEPRLALGVAGSLSGADFLLEPGASAPKATREFDDDEDEDEEPAVPRNSGINAHIAAARRAAQAALMESAAKSEAASAASRARGSDEPARTPSLKQAREFLAARRGPVLLGIAFLAVAATLAMVVFRGGHGAPVQKSELSAPTRTAAPIAAVPADRSSKVDLAPIGALSAARPTPSPAPADLVAGLPSTLPRALRDAATSGDASAETEVAIRWLDGRMPSRDPKIAARWFEAAATQALPVAQYRLAALYEKGVGVARDVQLARSWYIKAATAGNARAMHNLAVLNAENGESGKPDYAEAAQWFRRAGELGIRDSQFNLGVLYGRGLGVPQDLGQSWVWFSLAARQGDGDAGKKRDEVAAKMDAKALASAAQALADFKTITPAPAANEPPAPAGGWGDAPTPQASAPAVPTPAPAAGAGRV
jgi:localization factor PodJL